MSDKIGSLIIGLQNTSLSAEENEILPHPLIGGVILFTRNYESPQQLQHLCQKIRAVNPGLLIMVDQEGGRVQRFLHGFSRLPEMGCLGDTYNECKETALHAAKQCGWLMATELLSHGIDLGLSPVLDVNKGISEVIGRRAFHRDPQNVVTLATAYIKGMKEAGMAATGKHFPGHGSTHADTHTEWAVDERSFAAICEEDLHVFAAMVQAGIPSLMTAHVIFPQVDHMPASFSARWLQDILRHKLGFSGIVFSDDLGMEGASMIGDFIERFQIARKAGCDFVLICNNQEAVIEILDHVSELNHQIESKRCDALRGNFSNLQSVPAKRLQQARALINLFTTGNSHATYT